MIVDGYSSQPHYSRHLQPILDRFEGSILWTRGRSRDLNRPTLRRMDQIRRADVVLVASGIDAAWLQHSGVQRLVYVEHGAGQAYPADPRAALFGSYSGGAGLDHVAMFLCPSETVAERWRAVYRAPAVVVGCPALDAFHLSARFGPSLDALHRTLRFGPSDEEPKRKDPLVVGWTWHWDCNLCPETRTAWPHYAPQMAQIVHDLRSRGMQVLGHSHPKSAQQRGPDRQWKRLGVERVDYERLLVESDVLVADNTSALYEFASLGKPVVVLNAPWYRREVEHGLRFWSHLPGIQCDLPDYVVEQIEIATNPEHPWAEELRARRERAVEHVYAYTDGRAAERAADAIAMLVEADT